MAKGDPKTISGSLPQRLEAFQILVVGAVDSKTAQRQILLANGSHVVLTGKQLAAFLPAVGDYYVVPSEGHPYCIGKSAFQQAYIVAES